MYASISAKIHPDLKARLDVILQQEKTTINHFINELLEKAVIAKECEMQADRQADAVLSQRLEHYYAGDESVMDWHIAKKDIRDFVKKLQNQRDV